MFLNVGVLNTVWFRIVIFKIVFSFFVWWFILVRFLFCLDLGNFNLMYVIEGGKRLRYFEFELERRDNFGIRYKGEDVIILFDNY